MKAVLSHPHVAEWIDKAQDEPWVIEQYEAARPPRRALRVIVGRPVLVDVAAVGGEHHVDVRIAAARIRAAADDMKLQSRSLSLIR